MIELLENKYKEFNENCEIQLTIMEIKIIVLIITLMELHHIIKLTEDVLLMQMIMKQIGDKCLDCLLINIMV